MKLAVTGASGFLGSHLARRAVADGHRVLAPRRPNSSPREHDGVDYVSVADGGEFGAYVATEDVDAVFHLATHYIKSHVGADLTPLVEANIAFGLKLFDALRGTAAPVVSTMSFFQFEDGEPAPLSLYAATKLAFFEIGRYYRDREGLDVRHVVLYDSYGPGDTRDKLIPALVAAARAGSPVQLGAAEQLLNMLYVDDVVDGLLAAAQPGEAALTTVRAPHTVSVGEIVAAVGRAAGRPLDAQFAASGSVSDRPLRAGEWPTPRSWVPQVALEDGLTRTLGGSAVGGPGRQ